MPPQGNPKNTEPPVGTTVMPPAPAVVATTSGNHMVPNLLIALGFLILGLAAGAGGGYLFGKVDGVSDGIQQTTEAYQEAQLAQQAEQAALESTYADIQTNPLDEVTTNPFE